MMISATYIIEITHELNKTDPCASTNVFISVPRIYSTIMLINIYIYIYGCSDLYIYIYIYIYI